MAAVALLLLSPPTWGQEPGGSAVPYPVGPVSGPSLLTKLKAGVDLTVLGRLGMQGVIPAEVEGLFERPDLRGKEPGWWLGDGFSLSGADFYRLNCRSCHGVAAQGLGPVIPALLEPVKASSADFVKERMKERGRPIPDELAEKLAQRAKLSLRHRLQKGGLVMPPFSHLEGEEVDAVLEFLAAIAGVSKDGAPLRVHQSAARVGEHIVKSTCLVCHDATGGRYRSAVADQVIPALEEIPKAYSAQEFIRKVRAGSPTHGNPRGRMPRFTYLTEEELSAAYVYLLAYPPQRESQ